MIPKRVEALPLFSNLLAFSTQLMSNRFFRLSIDTVEFNVTTQLSTKPSFQTCPFSCIPCLCLDHQHLSHRLSLKSQNYLLILSPIVPSYGTVSESIHLVPWKSCVNFSFSIASATTLVKLVVFSPKELLASLRIPWFFAPYLPFHPMHYTQINHPITQFLLHYSLPQISMAPLLIQWGPNSLA